MIALLAAVPEETDLIRGSLKDSAQQSINGIDLISGKLSHHEICLAHSGIGKAAAAAAATILLYHCRPEALWLFGCGGAYPGSGLKVGDLAIASTEIFGDEGVATDEGFRDLAEMKLPMRQAEERLFNCWPVDKKLHDWAHNQLVGYTDKTELTLRSGAFVTLSTCTGTTAKAIEIESRTTGICENMEGAAVALACQQMSAPLLEVRGISNLVEDRDTSRWNLPIGMAAAQKAILALLQAWPEQRP
jgi:futalosine hydrolase